MTTPPESAKALPPTAVLGLGFMGGAIALRLHRQGVGVIGWNRTAEKAEPLAGEGLPVAQHLQDVLLPARVILLVLSDAHAIGETLFTPVTVPLLAEKTLIQMGTIAPEESRAIAERVTRAGGHYLEAPVLGSLPEAFSGNLIVMTGGDQVLHERLLPLLSHLGRAIRRIGGVGQAAALKLAMNQLIAGLTASFSLSLGLVRAQGLEVDSFLELLRQSALYAPTFDKKLPNYLSHDYARANFPLRHLLKDIRLFERVAALHGLDTGLPAALATACQRGIDAGNGEADYSALYEALTRKP
jgi:3-hydroxyisobutyrate dehydrogenase